MVMVQGGNMIYKEAYLQDNHVFAALFNRALFDGRQFFRADELTDCALPQLSYYAAFYNTRAGSIEEAPELFRIAKRLNRMRLTLLLVVLKGEEGVTASFTDHARSIVTVSIGCGTAA